MEWIVGLLVLWGISAIAEKGKSSGKESDRVRRGSTAPASAEERRKQRLEELQKELGLPSTPKKDIRAAPNRPAKSPGKSAPAAREATNLSGGNSNFGTVRASRPAASCSRQDTMAAWDEWAQYGGRPGAEIGSAEYLDARKFLESKGVTSFWHITHQRNVNSILKDGILSHRSAHATHQVADISNASVQTHRTKLEPVYNRSLHDYAPLYVNVRNPMLYVRKDFNDEICLLEISLEVLRASEERGIVIADGNAASGDTGFSGKLEDLRALPWDVLCADYWTDFADGKRKRCVEVLVYPAVLPAQILAVHCCSGTLAGQLSSKGINAVCDSARFFGG